MGLLLVGVGGSLGALLRYQLSRWLDKRQHLLSFPLATFVINITGSFLLGWLTQWLGVWFPHWGSAPMLFLGVGLCGAYTTFSTFNYESLMLFQERRPGTALLYMLSSFLLASAAAGLGMFGLPARF